MENLNAEQVKKALECCTIWGGCDNCPFETKGDCYKGSMECGNELMKNALALITSQEQRIKELSEENERLKKSAAFLADMPDGEIERIKTACLEKIELDVKAIRADTVRKMQERLKEWYHFSYKGKMYVAITDEEIDQIAKEMLEEGVT